jgi:GNAT superfamily N-acetyltransferase
VAHVGCARQAADVDITQPGLDDTAAMRRWYDVWLATRQVDEPEAPNRSFEELVGRSDESTYQHEYLLGTAAGTDVGVASIRYTMRDNLSSAELGIWVHPRCRRRGHGRQLAEAALAQVRARGRTQVVGGLVEALDGSPSPGAGLAGSLGARRVRVDTHRVLDLTRLDLTRIEALDKEAAELSAGYELVSWVGPAPDDLVADYAALIGRLSTDAPQDDLDWETESWDVDRVRRRDDVIAEVGRRLVVTAARPVGGGPLVAYTDVGVTTHDPDNVFQWDTLVLSEHRGHRLGTRVKVANLELVRREAPHAKRLHTWNADSNSHMLAINEAMGFVPLSRESEWQLDLDRAGD